MGNTACPTGLQNKILSGNGNTVEIINIPYPAAGKSVIDFIANLSKPADAIYYPSFPGNSTPNIGYSFTPQNTDLNAATGNGAAGLIALNALVTWKWSNKFQRIYFSVQGLGAGGNVIILALNGFKFQSPSS